VKVPFKIGDRKMKYGSLEKHMFVWIQDAFPFNRCVGWKKTDRKWDFGRTFVYMGSRMNSLLQFVCRNYEETIWNFGKLMNGLLFKLQNNFSSWMEK
jgi:hypothetical protein